MKKHHLTLLVAILVLGAILALCAPAWITKAMPQDSNEQSMGLNGILFGLGRDYDCFFTIEGAWQEGEPTMRLEAALARRVAKKSGLINELNQLRRSIADFAYEIDGANPRIVHIIDARLRRQKGYAIDALITSLDFAGKVSELPDEIGKQGISIALPTWQSTHEQRDGSTVVHVKGAALIVRDALSSFVKLDGRGPILWIARTKLEQGAITYVHYPWPGRMAKQ